MLRGCVLLTALLLVWMSHVSIFAQAQSGDAPPPPANASAQQPFTIHAESRVVLSDVTVQDSHGNPVHGLAGADFHVFDNGKPQTIDSFQEHGVRPGDTYVSPSPNDKSGVFSNESLKSLPPVLNVVVLDISNMEVVDQMYLNIQLTKFFEQAPLDQPLAMYFRTDSGCFPVTDFTADRAVLLAALHRSIPRFPPPEMARAYLGDLDTMHRLALSLSRFQGRKNILWFSSGSTMFSLKTSSHSGVDDPLQERQDAAWRVLYDELEQNRIALYPIDARGIAAGASGYSAMRRTPLPIGEDPGKKLRGVMAQQHMLMKEMAATTGGQAVYNANNLKEVFASLVERDRNYYTLTFSPRDFKADGKYHKVSITLADGSHYALSYRQGYFADGSAGGATDSTRPAQPRTRLLADGEKLVEPPASTEPILFDARLLRADSPEAAPEKVNMTISAAPSRHGSKPYVIRYAIPFRNLKTTPEDGRQQIRLMVASYELSDTGEISNSRVEVLAFTLTNEAAAKGAASLLAIDQPVNLAKGDKYLYLVVGDPVGRRIGTIEVPVATPK